MVSFFALALSCLNSGARILFTMGRYGIFPISIGSSHKHNLTPHIAITSFAILQFLIPTFFMLLMYAGASQVLQIGAPIDVFNDAGLFGAMGFCCAYVLISIAAPFYLYKIGELKARHIMVSAAALILLLVPIIGPFWPNPAPYPTNLFPYFVGVYLLIGIVTVFMRSRTTTEMARIRQVIEESTVGPLPTSPAPAVPPVDDGLPAMA
jgi:amino acid transporter